MDIIGSNANDTLVGTTAVDSIDGGHGVDVIDGGGGADKLFGDDGADVILGSGGGDTIQGGDGNDVLVGGGVPAEFIEYVIASGSGFIDATQFLPIADDGAADSFFGGDGADIVVANPGDSADGGNGGDDTLVALFQHRQSAITINFGTNANAAMGAALGGSVSRFENFSLVGTAFGDSVNAGNFNLEFYGLGGSDTVVSGSGDDTVDATTISMNYITGEGTDDGVADTTSTGDGFDDVTIGRFDSADGGAGFDSLTVNLRAAPSAINFTLGADPNAAIGAAVGGTVANFEFFQILLGASADTVTSNNAAVVLMAGGGNDTITESLGGQFYAEDGDDRIDASAALSSVPFNIMDGGDGADTLIGGAGSDQIQAGSSFNGVDLYADDGDADTITAGAGDDSVYIGVHDNADGGTGADRLVVDFSAAGAGVSVNLATPSTLNTAIGGTVTGFEYFNFYGSNFADSFVSVASDTSTHIFAGLDGADTLTGGNGADTLEGGDGSDTLTGGGGNDTLWGNINDSLTGLGQGGPFADDGDADVLNGGDGIDRIYAGLGDSVDGGAGAGDVLWATFVGRTSGITLDMSAGEAAPLAAALGGSVSGIEMFGVIGSGFADAITGGAATDAIYGLGGADTITLTNTSVGLSNLAVGGAGADTLNGGAGNDRLVAGDATDTDVYFLQFGLTFDINSDVEIDTVNAGAGNDIIYAGAGDNIDGGAGADLLYLNLIGRTSGVTANLTANANTALSTATGSTIQNIESFRIIATNFNDSISGGAGAFMLEGRGGDDILSSSNATGGALTGGDGDDVLSLSGSGVGTLDGGDGDDLISGGGGGDTINGGDGDDVIFGASGNDNINAGDGNDYVDAGIGSDTVAFDTELVDSAVVQVGPLFVVTGPQGKTTIRDAEILTFSDGGFLLAAAPISGTAAANNLTGGAGSDTLIGLAGADTLDGLGGSDTASYANDTAAVFVQLGWGWARDGFGAEDRLVSIENVVGSAFNDVLISYAGDSYVFGGSGSDWIEDIGGGNDWLEGEAGNDIIFGADGDDTLNGGSGLDALLGGIGNDTLSGGSGIDWVYGGLGADVVSGGDQNDVLFGAEGGGATSVGDLGDVISGGDGDDALIGEDGDDILDGGAGVDWAYGGAGADTLLGGDGDDVLIGGDGASGPDGADTINGGLGNDALVGQAGDDALDAGAGNDWAYGGEGNDAIAGGDGNDVLAGENGNDTITGGLGDDFIFGGNGFDTLDGGAGNDWIEGSFGGARITGGAGADNLFGGDAATFVYTATSDSTEAAADVIGIFWRPGGDKIDVSAIDADGNAGNGDTAFSFVSAFTNVAGQAVLSYDGTNSIARFDTNGDGVSDMSIVVLATQLQAGDFIA